MCSVARGTHAREDVHERLVGVERRLVGIGDLGRRLRLEPGLRRASGPRRDRTVLAQVADVGDVLDVEHVEPW
jgi:hypothetical protein